MYAKPIESPECGRNNRGCQKAEASPRLASTHWLHERRVELVQRLARGAQFFRRQRRQRRFHQVGARFFQQPMLPVSPAALLFQNARHDALNVEQDVLDFHQAASEPKTVKWYEAYHQLNDEAEQDRAEWLRQQLSLKATPQLAASLFITR
jgi:hypothetical protein